MPASSIGVSVSAQIATPIDNDLVVYTPYTDISEYRGTRSMLEAEGVIPAGTEWPNGYAELGWENGGAWFSLCRHRPDGAKGPRHLFAEVDWWHLRFKPAHCHGNRDREILRKQRELNDYIRNSSPEGMAENSRRAELFFAAKRDSAFQGFKEKYLPFVIRRRRGGKSSAGRHNELD